MRPFHKQSIAKHCTMLFVLTSLLNLPHLSWAQLDQWGYWDNGVSESWWFSSADFNKDEALAAVTRWHRLGREIKDAPNGEWTGDYFRGGETHGAFLRWSTKSGFVMANVDKCQAKVMGLSYGKVEVSPTKFEFVTEFSKSAKDQHSHSHSSTMNRIGFVPIKWHGKHMLVAENEMSDFGDFFAGLGKYNYSDFLYFYNTEFFTRGAESSEDATISSELKPRVPPDYEHFLKRPITATITAVGKRLVKGEYSYENPDGTGTSYHAPVSLTFVAIDAGFRNGLRKGMFLQVVDPDEGDRVRIIHVAKSSSTGIIIRDVVAGSESFFNGDSDKPRLHSKIKAGWKLTTSHL